ncbi:MAG: PHP domain-containing protein [Candidatus Methanoperedens sp.]|nr:PHP domain-containing protein [Candidatus Methanoperedens sp.]
MKDIGVGDIHTHTMYSGFTKYKFLSFPDSVTTPRTSIKVAEKLGLNALCITDHNTIKGALVAQKYNKDLVVIGEEISSREGEILGLFLQEKINPGLSAEETIEQIHCQDGIAVAPHPYSGHCSCVAEKMNTLRFDGIEVFNSLHRDGYSNALALKNCNGHAKLGGSDAHSSHMIGNGYTLFNGSSQEDFRNAIKNRQTIYGGKVASLLDFINYSTRVAYESSKTILKFNGVDCPMSARISRVRNSRKASYLLGSVVYAFSPLPFVCTLLGDRVLKHKGLRMWKDAHRFPLIRE